MAGGAFKGEKEASQAQGRTHNYRTFWEFGVLFTRVRKYSHRYRSQPKRRIDKLVIPSVGHRCFRNRAFDPELSNNHVRLYRV